MENFLGFPVGTPIPAGYYDRQRGMWVASTNGVVIKVLSVTSGLANVDTDGDGAADTGISMTTDERQRLATLYTPGTILWRVGVPHFSLFSNWDMNFGIFPPLDAIFSKLLKGIKSLYVNDACQSSGSVIDCENQVLGETISLVGTPFSLHYQSDRVPGRRESYGLEIPLSGASLPASLKRIDLDVEVAGRNIRQSFPATPNQQTTFTWDGLDAYGRRVQGRQPVTVRLNYVYDGTYRRVTSFASSTGTITGVRGRSELNLVEFWQGTLGTWDARAERLGGWTLSAHHIYDSLGHVLDLGNGQRRTTEGLPAVVKTIAGNGISAVTGDGGAATAAQVSFPYAALQAPDGSVYGTDNGRIRKISPLGIITTVAGTGPFGFNGDGGPATSAQLNAPIGLALGADGSLYIADFSNHRVRRVGPDGIISTVAGNGTPGFGGDGGPATAAMINRPFGLAMGPDGSLYLSENGVFPSNGTGHRVRRVGPDGIITTVAWTGTWGYNGGDGGPATAANLSTPSGLAIGPDGSVYIADNQAHRIRRVGTDGIIRTVAGSVTFASFGGDGGQATSAGLAHPLDVEAGTDGTLYIADTFNHRIRQVAPDGIITTMAGTGSGGFGGEGGSGPSATFNEPRGIGIGLAGDLYIADQVGHRIRRLASPFPGFSLGDVVIPAQDGSELYVFDRAGRHLRTTDALTNAIKYQFAYNGAGLLTTVTDADGNITTIERDGTGNATGILASGGQRTTVTVDANGSLASLKNPANETVSLTYSADGLLATLKDAKNQAHQYTYDAQGRLLKDQDPAAGFKALTRTEQSTGWTIALSTALNRTTTYQVEHLLNGDTRRKVTVPSNLLTTTLIKPTGTTTITAPDGTLTTQVEGPDPRFGMQAPLLKSLTVQTPAGLTSTLTTTRAVTLSNPTDPLSLATQTDTLVINGRTYTSTYAQATRLLSTTTPASRTSSVTLDAKGRVVQEQMTGLEAVAYSYDSLGRLSAITQGTGATARTSTLTYNSKNELTSILDPLNRSVSFAYDLAGRISTQTLPDTRQIGYSYDGNGNVTSITPPGRPQHMFSYTPVDLESNYTPPDLGFSPRHTQYTYNLDRQLTLVTRPDGQTIQLGYEPTGGRLSTLTLPGSITLNYAYSATTGNLSSITAPGNTLTYTYDGSLQANDVERHGGGNGQPKL